MQGTRLGSSGLGPLLHVHSPPSNLPRPPRRVLSSAVLPLQRACFLPQSVQHVLSALAYAVSTCQAVSAVLQVRLLAVPTAALCGSVLCVLSLPSLWMCRSACSRAAEAVMC